MRIYSTYFDYYDGVASSWSDDDTVYRRVERSEPLSDERIRVIGLPALERFSYYYSHDIQLLPCLVGFCGHLIPYVTGMHADNADVRLWSAEELSEWPLYARHQQERGKRGWRHYEDRETKHLKAQHGRLDAPFLELGVPIFHVWWEPRAARSHTEWRRIITLDPFLKPLEFYRQKDAQTAYQELEQYLGSVLTRHEVPSEVSDADKLQQHGYDPKLSFRKARQPPGVP